MGIRRIIESTIGHNVLLEIGGGDRWIEMSRVDLPNSPPVRLGLRAARILSAFLTSALVTDRSRCQPERIDDVEITMQGSPPAVHVRRGGALVELHAPVWEPLHCEIDIITPRLVGAEEA